MKILKKLQKNEKGSITIFVLAVMIFMIMVLGISYVSIENKKVAHNKRIEKIEEEYTKAANTTETIDQEYIDTINRLDMEVYIMLFKKNGEKYSVNEWTNEDLTMRLYYKYEMPNQEKYFYIDGQKIQYTKDYTISKNCTIRAEYQNKITQLRITKIDKESPTIKLSNNGGTFVVPTGREKSTIKTSIEVKDTLSGIKQIQYAWSTSEAEEPGTGWTEIKTGEEVTKTECDAGNYYLWVKAIDNAGNEEKQVSQSFTVLTKEQSESSLILKTKPSIDEWTNQDIVIVPTYGTGLTENKKITSTGTANTDYVIEGSTKVTIKTNNQTVTVEAEDKAGNKIVKTVSIDKIDKIEPTVTLSQNGGIIYTMPITGNATIKTNLTAKDEGGSNLKTMQYAWSTSNQEEPTTGWTNFKNGEEVSKTDCTAGNYYLWTKVMDAAGNRASQVKISNVFTVGSNTLPANQITLTASTTAWTNKDVTVTINYGKNLTQNRKAGIGQADTANATTLTVKENGTVYAEATDIAGNKITASLAIKNIDKTNPSIDTLTNSSNGNWAKGTVTVTLTGSDNLSGIKEFQWYENNAWTTRALTTAETKGTITYSAERNTTIRYRVVDNAGNASEEKTTLVKLDNTKPIAPTYVAKYEDNTSYTSGTWTNKKVYTEITSEDTLSGIDYIECSTDKTTWTKLEFSSSNGIKQDENKYTGKEPWTLKNRDETYYFRATDKSGNVSEISEGFNIKYDITLPTVMLSPNGGDKYTMPTSGNATIKTTLTANDEGGSSLKTMKYAWSTSNTEKPTSGWSDFTSGQQVSKTDCQVGNYYLWVKAIDNAGNENSTKVSNVFTVGANTLAANKITLKQNTTAWTNQNVTVTVSYGANLTQNKKAGFGTASTANATTVAVAQNGTVYAEATDIAGNKITASLPITNIDKDLPTVSVNYNGYTKGDWTKDNVNISVTSQDELSGIDKIQYSTDNKTWNDITITKSDSDKTASGSIKYTTDTNQTLYYRAIDKAGNLSAVIGPDTVKIDKTAPAIDTITNSSNGSWSSGTVKVTLTGSDRGSGIKEFQWYENGAWTTRELTTNGNTATINYTTQRDLTIRYRVVDNVGNISEEKTTVVRIDKEKPTVSIGTNGGTYTITPGNTTANISTTLTTADTGGSGVSTRQYVWSTSNTEEPTSGWTNFTDGETIKASKGGGTHYLWIKVLDTAGNRCATIVSNAFVVNYQVVYDANGGSGAPEAQIKTHGTNLTLSSTKPTKSGYNFVGWSTSNTATSATYQPEGTYTNNAAVTLYAIWSKTITATFNYWDGSKTASTQVSKTIYNSTTQATLTAPTIANATKDSVTYIPRGWSGTNTGNATVDVNSGADVTLSANATYYATYSASITATFYYYNGSSQATTTASNTRYMNAGGSYVHSNITVPSVVSTSVGVYNTKYAGVASAVSSATIATPTTANTKFYAVYTVGVTYYYYNGSSHTSQAATRRFMTNGTTYSGSMSATPSPAAYDGVNFTAGNWSSSSTSVAKVTPATTAETVLYSYYQKTVTATFYYHSGDNYTNTQSSATADGTRTHISKSGGINTYQGSITIPSAVTGSPAYYNAAYKGVASAKSSSTAATVNTATTTYYAFYNCSLTYYYYNGSAHTSSQTTRRATSNGTGYVCTVDSVPTPSAYDGASFKWWSYDSTQTGTDYKREPNATAATSLYALYQKTITATFNYYNGSAAATTTASGTRSYISKSGGINTYNVNIAVPSAVSGSKGSASTTYSHVATTKTGGAVTPTTATTTYYAVYKKTVTATLYVYNNQSSTKQGTAYGYYDGTTANASIGLGTTTLSGYTFRGWSTSTSANASITVAANGTASIINNTTYYASYSYEVTTSYNVNGGSSTTPSSQKSTAYMNYTGSRIGTAITLPAAATRTGYTFSAWYTATSGGSKAGNASASYSPTATATLYAQWTANTYTVNYYNGATKLGSSSHTYDTAKNLTAISTLGGSQSGYTFYGWTTGTSTLSRSYTDGQSVNNLTSTNGGTVTLYAIWQRTANFYSGTSKATTGTAAQYYNPKGGNYTVTTPSTIAAITNWTTLGWRDDTTAGAKEITAGGATTSSSQNYYAVYSRTANFYSGTSKATTGTATQYYNSNNAYSVTTPSSITAITNWTTLGWRDDTTAGAKEITAGGATTSSSQNYYAVYSRTVTIAYNANGGSGTVSSQTATQYYNSNGGVSTPSFTLQANSYTRTGYRFSKWAAGSTSGTQYAASSTYTGFVPGVSASATQTMYAIWTANTYTVEYNGNGNTGGSTASSSHTYDTTKALTANGFTKTGYTFAGWATSESGSVSYSDKASVKNLTSEHGAKVTLYAKWTANTYTVKYNGNGATSGSTASSSHTYDTAKVLTANGFSKIGYSFSGWATSSSGSVSYADKASVKNLTTMNEGTVNLYAVWVDKAIPTMGTLTASTTAWTNNNVTLTGKATDLGSGISYYQFSTDDSLTASSNGWISITNTNTETTQTYSVSSNATYYFYVKDAAGNINKSSIIIKNIDKIEPTLKISGGEYYYKKGDTSSKTYTIALGSSISDTGGSGANSTTVYYAWSTSSTSQPSSWSTASVGSNINLQISTLQPINYYLWTKVSDNAKNEEIKATTFSLYEISVLTGPTKTQYLQSESEVSYAGIQLLKYNNTNGNMTINSSKCTFTSTDNTERSNGIRFTISVKYQNLTFTIYTYKSGWYGSETTNWYYWESNNQYAVGERTISYENITNDYYFNADGTMYWGWRKVDTKWLYYVNIATNIGHAFFENGIEEMRSLGLASGAKVKNMWLYISSDSKTSPAYWYHFDSEGYMQTGWILLDGKWYYLKPSGFSGWSGPVGSMLYSTSATINGKTYNFNASGVCTNP